MKHSLTTAASITALWLAITMQSAPAQAATFFYHTDHLGTPQALTDDNQEIVWQTANDPFGEATDVVSAVEQNLRFPGQYFDSETRLHYNYFREYDFTLGRYLQSDPIGLEGGINTYAYVGGNPIAYIDPLGLLSVAACANPINAATCAAAGIGVRTASKSVSRSIIQPKKPKCGCTCNCRADANDNIPGNIQAGERTFAFGMATEKNCIIAKKVAKRRATRRLGKQPKHVACICTGK